MKVHSKGLKVYKIIVVIAVLVMCNILVNQQHITQATQVNNKCTITLEKTKEKGEFFTGEKNVKYNYKVVMKITSQDSLYGMQFKVYHDKPAKIVATNIDNNVYFSNQTINQTSNRFMFWNTKETLKSYAPNNEEVCILYFFVAPSIIDNFNVWFDFSNENLNEEDDFESLIIKNNEKSYSNNEILYPKEPEKNSNSGDSENTGTDNNDGQNISNTQNGQASNDSTAQNNEANKNTNDSNCSPKAGDNIIIYISLITIAAVIFIIILAQNRKNKRGGK